LLAGVARLGNLCRIYERLPSFRLWKIAFNPGSKPVTSLDNPSKKIDSTFESRSAIGAGTVVFVPIRVLRMKSINNSVLDQMSSAFSMKYEYRAG
jgi:hypothetical protein